MAPRYLLITGAVSLAALLVVALTNIVIDPAWRHSVDHALNARQEGFDERSQKANWLAARRPAAEIVLIGSSRTTFIDVDGIAGRRVFNAAVSQISPREYRERLEAFERITGRAIGTIVIGLDFFAALQLGHPTAPTPPPQGLAAALRENLSLDLFQTSLRNVRASVTGDEDRTYDRSLRRLLPSLDAGELRARTAYELRKFDRHLYRDIAPDWALFNAILVELRQRWRDAEILFFTTPVAAPQFDLVACTGRAEAYATWLRQIVRATGVVHHFMDRNVVTERLENFADSHHFRAQVGRWIVQRVFAIPDGDAPAGFGIRLEPGSVEGYLAESGRRFAAVDCGDLRRTWGL